MAMPERRDERERPRRSALPGWLTAAFAGADATRTILMSALHIALIWCLAAVVIWQNYEQSVESWKRSAENLSLAVAAHAAQTHHAANLVLSSIVDWVREEDIATADQFRQIAGGRSFYDNMRTRVAAAPQVGMAFIADADGKVLNSLAGWPPLDMNISGREAFKLAMAERSVQSVVSATTPALYSAAWRFYVARKVTTQSGTTLGVVGVGLDAEHFASFFRSVSLGPDSWISLFRADGTLLATSQKNQDALGKRYDTSRPYRLIKDGQSGKAALTHDTSFFPFQGGDARIVVASQVDGFPAYVGVAIGESAFLGPWRNRNILILGIAALLTLLTVLAALSLLRLVDRAEAARRADSERQVLAAIVDTPSALTAIVDRSGRIVHGNAQFLEMMGRDGKAADALLDPAVKGMASLLKFASASEPATAEIDVEVERSDGQARRLHFSLSRQALPDTGACIVMVGHDETVRYRAQQAIAMSARLVTLGEITSSIAHEVSQPLNVIRMAAQNALAEAEPEQGLSPDDPVIAQTMSDAEFREFAVAKFGRVISQVDRAASIVSRMRIFSRKPGDGPQSFDVRAACRGAIALLAHSFRGSNITINEKFPDEALVAQGTQTLVEQAVVYLLRNARDALIQLDRPTKTIDISAYRTAGGRIVVRVADNGPGVPPAIRERIFEPFFTTKPNDKHAGLGLAVAFGSVRDCGGELTLVPDEPGAVFQIELPGEVQAKT